MYINIIIASTVNCQTDKALKKTRMPVPLDIP